MVSVHKPGAFKQTNKQHKTGKHRSKGALDAESKGWLIVHGYLVFIFST